MRNTAPSDSGFDRAFHKSLKDEADVTHKGGHVLQGVIEINQYDSLAHRRKLKVGVYHYRPYIVTAAARGDGPRITYPRVVKPVNSQLDSEATIASYCELESRAQLRIHMEGPFMVCRSFSVADHHRQREDLVGFQSRRA
jgi:hypothetical protein